VHGFAGVIGGQTGAPHGEICGALLPAVLASHLDKAEAGTQIHTRLMWVLGLIDSAFNVENGAGITALRDWSRQMGLRTLAEMGLNPEDHAEVARLSAGASSMKGTPFALSQDELIAILRA
jgi:alcohol dehydrogenase class IV